MASGVITVCGETVIDMVAQPDGDFRAYPAGSPANAAVALARLDEPVEMAARLGTDVFGRQLRAHLSNAGVGLRTTVESPDPTVLAVVSLDEARRATYDFWTQGAPDWQWTDAELAQHPIPGCVAFHTGSLASWIPPGDEALLRVFQRVRAARSCTLSYDPNVRPGLLGDRSVGRARIERFVASSHLVKVSDEDLAWLYPDRDAADLARSWSALGPDLVVVTLGGEGALAVRRGREDVVRRVAPRVEVVDTVGAGDTFTAGLLHALAGHGALGADPSERLAALSDNALAHVVDVACTAAALTCTRENCDPPTLLELHERLAGGREGRPADLR